MEFEEISDAEREEYGELFARHDEQFIGVVKGTRTHSSLECFVEKDGQPRVAKVYCQTGMTRKL